MKAILFITLFFGSFLALAETQPQEPPGCIGIALELKNGEVVVDGILPNTPAAADGRIAVGDRIVAVESAYNQTPWTPTEGLTLEQVVSLIRGPVGAVVALDVMRDGRDFAVALPRAVIPQSQPKPVNL